MLYFLVTFELIGGIVVALLVIAKCNIFRGWVMLYFLVMFELIGGCCCTFGNSQMQHL